LRNAKNSSTSSSKMTKPDSQASLKLLKFLKPKKLRTTYESLLKNQRKCRETNQ